MANVIALLTDFGIADTYVGVMKGVMLGVHPTARFVDIAHDIQPQSVRQAALALWNSYRYFPDGTVFLIVVDPGVGSQRLPIGVQAGTYTFIAPDNGVISYALQDLKEYTAVALTNPDYHRELVSHSFHGRDIFAPAAAHIAKGVPLTDLGPIQEDLFILPYPQIHVRDRSIAGEITHIDRFGNIITSIGKLLRVDDSRILLKPVSSDRTVRLKFVQNAIIKIFDHTIHGIGRAYYESPRGHLMAKIDSNGYLELAINQGSAAERTGAMIGDEVVLTMPDT